MEYKSVWTKLPYDVHHHVHRGRELRHETVWEEVPLSICAPTVDEAPIAYRITRTSPKHDARPDHEIRTFEDHLWWPVLDSNNSWCTAEAFLSGLAKGGDWTAAILHPKLARYCYASHKPTYTEVFRNIRVRGEPRTSRDEMLALSGRGASQIMVCGGRMYVQGGEPLYYAFPLNHCDRQITFEVGTSPWKGFRGNFTNLPGPTGKERRSALYDAHIYDLHTLQDELATFEQQGYCILLEGSVETLKYLAISQTGLHMSADAALCNLLAEVPVNAAFRNRVAKNSIFQEEARVLVPLEVCHAVLTDIVDMFPADTADRVFNDKLLCAQRVLKRLERESARSITDLDNFVLSSLG